MADRVKVELQDSNGNVYFPFTRIDCVTLEGTTASRGLSVVLDDFERRIKKLESLTHELSSRVGRIEDGLSSTIDTVTGHAEALNRLRTAMDEVEQKANRALMDLKGKADKDGSTYVYRGVITNFDAALKTGWYHFVNSNNEGYGVLRVQNATQYDHNGQSTWIWQEKWTTAGTRQWRHAVNNDGWSPWRND